MQRTTEDLLEQKEDDLFLVTLVLERPSLLLERHIVT